MTPRANPSRRPRWRLLLSIALVYAILLPLYGSLISPAFIELLPNHAHIHPSGHLAPHLHSYETPPDAPNDGSGVFAIPPDNDGSSAGGLAAAALAALILLAAPPILRPIASQSLARLVGVTPPTNHPPPRLAPLLS